MLNITENNISTTYAPCCCFLTVMHMIADFLCTVTIRHAGLFVHCIDKHVLGFTVKLCVSCFTSYTHNIILAILFRQGKQFVNFKSEYLLFFIQCNNVTFAYIIRINLVPLVSFRSFSSNKKDVVQEN